ncbi:hypothetical protein ACIBAC_15255 [Streptomyces sp. NPDC051362]|uniref:hypothetical protein n=1 Tax=Streptomyces sp. NPDC051362 TaxID=3365651 RepID=UPI0037ABAC31
MTTLLDVRLPSVTFAAGIQLSTGVTRGAVPTVLAFHVPTYGLGPAGVAEDVPTGMQMIARSLGLGPLGTPPPNVGECIEMRRGTPFLDYGHPDYTLGLPANSAWREAAQRSGPVLITLLFEPLWPRGAAEVDAHYRHCVSRGAVEYGFALVRRPFTSSD